MDLCHRYLLLNEKGEKIEEQTGIVRTNCIDCLDRTNVTQVGLLSGFYFTYAAITECELIRTHVNSTRTSYLTCYLKILSSDILLLFFIHHYMLIFSIFSLSHIYVFPWHCVPLVFHMSLHCLSHVTTMCSKGVCSD